MKEKTAKCIGSDPFYPNNSIIGPKPGVNKSFHLPHLVGGIVLKFEGSGEEFLGSRSDPKSLLPSQNYVLAKNLHKILKTVPQSIIFHDV